MVSSILIPQNHFTIPLMNESFLKLFNLVLTYSVAVLPYFFAGWILGSLFRDQAEQIHRLYFIDLLGAGLGCLAYLALINPLGAVNLVILTCCLPFSALFPLGKRRFVFKAAAGCTLGLLALLFIFRGELERGIIPEKSKSYNSNYADLQPGDERVVEHSEWNAISRIDVVSTRKHPEDKRIYIDGDALTGIVYAPPAQPDP